jgi:hypothetical protein
MELNDFRISGDKRLFRVSRMQIHFGANQKQKIGRTDFLEGAIE